MSTTLINNIQVTTIGNSTFISLEHSVINIAHIISVHLVLGNVEIWLTDARK